jgi:hypothetical protein
MRRDGIRASIAAKKEGIKLETLRRGAGRYLYRKGPGKPWKARTEDQLATTMFVLTDRGPVEVVVANSSERRILHRYDIAVRNFRGDKPGALKALSKFEGQTVGGLVLVTDPTILLRLEQAELIDVEAFYAEVGGQS